MLKRLLLFILLIPLSTFGQTQQPIAATAAPPADSAPLNLVIAQVKAALDLYQKNLGSGSDALPPLSTAEFDFKTTTATTAGGTINLFIFKIGGSHENDVVNDVTYTYKVPAPPKALRTKKPPTLPEALASTIQNAAAAVKTFGNLGNLSFRQLTVNIQYGVKWEGQIGANVPISLVTVGLSGAKNKNTVQSVKLVFGQ